MFTKRLFWGVQLVCLLVLGLILVVGDRSQPKIRSLSISQAVSAPIIVEFDRPIQKESVEKGWKLRGSDQQEVTGEFSWSSRSVAFTPKQPLQYGMEYSLTLADAEDMEGHVLRVPYHTTFSAPAPAFFYISSNYELFRYQVDTRENKRISSPGERVMDYEVLQDGSLFVSVRLEATSNQYGLYKLDSQGNQEYWDRGSDHFYDSFEVCNGEASFLGMRRDIDSTGIVTSTRLVERSLATKKETVVLEESQLGSRQTLACARSNDQFVYRDRQDNLILSSLSERENNSVGMYQFFYGFSPQDTTLLVGEVTTQDYPLLRAVYGIDRNGLRSLLVSEKRDATDPRYDPYEQILAVAEEVDGERTNDYLTRLQVVLYRDIQGGKERLTLAAPPQSDSDERPQWSGDGRYLTFERINQEDVGMRSQDVGGRIIDGEIWLATVSAYNSLLTQQPVLEPLGIHGSAVTWLP